MADNWGFIIIALFVLLVRKRCLHMEHEGKEHHYTLTKTGLRCLAKHEVEKAGDSIAILAQLQEANKNPKTRLERVQATLDYIRYELEGGEDSEIEKAQFARGEPLIVNVNKEEYERLMKKRSAVSSSFAIPS